MASLPHSPITGAGDPWRGAGPAPKQTAPCLPGAPGTGKAGAIRARRARRRAEPQGKMPRCDTGGAPRDSTWGQVRDGCGRRQGTEGPRSRDRRCHAPRAGTSRGCVRSRERGGHGGAAAPAALGGIAAAREGPGQRDRGASGQSETGPGWGCRYRDRAKRGCGWGTAGPRLG